MPYQVLASTTASNVIQGDPSSVVYAAWQVITGRQDVTVLAQYVNPAIRNAEESQPEGTLMELRMGSFVYNGVDYSFRVASWLNDLWQQGYLVEPNGRRLIPWPGYTRIAWGVYGYVLVRWKKMLAWVAILVIALLAALVMLYALSVLNATRAAVTVSKWTESPSPEACADKTGLSKWWCERSPLEKAALIATGVMMTGILVWFSMARSVAEAGAPKLTVITGGETY
ncbi:MAG: hypothetical protein ACPLRW_13100 [Moorellales bacterium]